MTDEAGQKLEKTSEAHAAAKSAQRKAAWRLLPIIAVGYGLACMDRVNVSFAALQMNHDLHFSATIYGFGAGLFFIGYALCEVPSNLLLLRFGPKRWLSRILFTWGILSAAMMLVRTPVQFYTLRFLLGMAEAGFFPGVVYYLTLWFPSRMRARAISRFYIALPLSSTVMGSLAGWLLGLNGTLGLAGWQWLFLVEGLPSTLFGLVILWGLPDGPAQATWLTDEERTCLQKQLAAEAEHAHLGRGAGVLTALLSPKVWMIGLYFFCALTCNYAFQFSAPAILQEATGWAVSRVGTCIAMFGLAGAAGMMLNSIHSDRRGERLLHCIVPCLVMGLSLFAAGVGRPEWLVVGALGASFVAYSAILGPSVAVPTQFMAGRAAAAGIAAMNTITMFSGFVGPYWMGLMKDASGSYWLGLRGLLIPSLGAVIAMLMLTRSLARSRPVAGGGVQLANETA
ncbi:MAG TPA: MFS transporter [Terracidiphilus sp.]|nr:MFS transporter [Terracidiphilus sp.]